MKFKIGSQSRNILIASLITLSVFWFETAWAQDATPLPDYVTKQYGSPPQFRLDRCPSH